MKYIQYIILILIFSLAFSACRTALNDEECSNYDYSDCNTIKPLDGALNIRLTINDQNPAVPVKVIKGHFEDGEVIWSDTLRDSKHTLYVGLNSYYTVTARYIVNGDTILAIDGDEVNSSSVVTCDSTCWSVTEGNADVRLK